MDKIIAFINAFIEQEYASLIVEKTEPDFEAYTAAIKALSHYCLPGLAGNFIGRRPLEPDADWYLDEAAAQTAYRKRTLLRIEQYQHQKLRDVYRCYVSDTEPENDAGVCSVWLYVAEIEGTLKIISIYRQDWETGRWMPRTGKYGIMVGKVGRLVDARDCCPPQKE
jgi:hypothetical protein